METNELMDYNQELTLAVDEIIRDLTGDDGQAYTKAMQYFKQHLRGSKEEQELKRKEDADRHMAFTKKQKETLEKLDNVLLECSEGNISFIMDEADHEIYAVSTENFTEIYGNADGNDQEKADVIISDYVYGSASQEICHHIGTPELQYNSCLGEAIVGITKDINY